MTSRALHLRGDPLDLTVEVVGDLARLALHHPTVDDAGPPPTVEVSARALVAALRAAWADEHDAPSFEPWRDRARRRPARDGLRLVPRYGGPSGEHREDA